MDLKGQSAIEYLLTYGWMLLVVAVAGGGLFSVASNNDIESVNGFTGSDVQIEDFGLNADEGLNFVLRNAASEETSIEDLRVIDNERDISAGINSEAILDVGESQPVEIKGVEKSEGSKTYHLEATYSLGGLTNLTTTGKITGSFEVFNYVDLQNVKFNRSTDTLSLEIKNTGKDTADETEYTFKTENDEITGDLGQTLVPGEEATMEIELNDTFSLQEALLDVTGSEFTDSDEQLQCTPTEGLIGYWTFNNEQTLDSENKTLDLSGNKNHGKLINGTSTGSSGQVGKAYEFDGEDDYVAIEDSEELNVTGGVTVSYWLNIEEYPTNTSLDEDSRYFPMYKERSYRPWIGPEGSIHFQLGLDGNWAENWIKTDSNVVKTDRWHMISTTYSESTENASIYLDGELIETGDPNGTEIDQTSENVIMGENNSEADWLNGSVDEGRIYSRALSENEVQRIHDLRTKEWAVEGCKIAS